MAPRSVRIDHPLAETLAHIAHELRQPLSAALAAFHVIRSTHDEDRRTLAAAVVDRQFHRLGRLIDDLTEVTLFRAHQPSLHIRRVDMRQATREVVDAIAPQARARHQHLAVGMPAEPLLVDADSLRLQQVISNLITNAVTYTGAGGSIQVSLQEQRGEAVLTVADSGEGIPPELLHRVFEPFVQGGGSQQGLGLGLAVARQLVELHRGQIRVESPGPGAGSTFIVSLPTATAQRAPASAAPLGRDQLH
jgi:signal transduction histidine kinase